MVKLTTDLLTGLEKDLLQLSSEEENIILLSEKSLYKAKACLNRLREFMLNYTFKSVEEEILFFKEIKPLFTSHVIYFLRVFQIESQRPTGSIETQKAYFNSQMNHMSRFFNDNLDFYQYYRAKSSYLDDKYFIRGREDIRLYLENIYAFSDAEFCTSHDLTVAKIMANDRLQPYLQNELDKLEKRNQSFLNESPDSTDAHFYWVDSKISLVELVYALVHTGSLRVGRARTDIKELTAFFEKHFHIELGDVYRTFLEIKGRSQQTKFLDVLRNTLKNKIEEDEK
ncbi:MAG: RteC domain-containing protein [Verrucomicrobia bacterium]|nr:RteC domain-containing protein [Cytophagales bacterium]